MKRSDVWREWGSYHFPMQVPYPEGEPLGHMVAEGEKNELNLAEHKVVDMSVRGLPAMAGRAMTRGKVGVQN